MRLITALGAISLLGIAAGWAEEPAASQSDTTATATVIINESTATTAAPAEAPVTIVKEVPSRKLPYGVQDVLKLSQAQVNDSITLSYIQNSGTIYDLRPNDIVYLKQQGVSDTVINAMMDQRKKAVDSAAQTQAQVVAAAAQQQQEQQQMIADASGAVTAPLTPTYSQGAPAYSEPAYGGESTLYVIGSPAVSYAYYNSYRPFYSYGYYGYYGAPYRYCGPRYCASTVVHFGGGHGFSHGGRSFHHH